MLILILKRWASYLIFRDRLDTCYKGLVFIG